MSNLPTAATVHTVCVVCGKKTTVTLRDGSPNSLEERQEQIQRITYVIRKNGLHGCSHCGTEEIVVHAEVLTVWLKIKLWFKRTFKV